MAAADRVSIGFSGGQVVEVRITDAKLKELRTALDKGDGWTDLETDEGTVVGRPGPGGLRAERRFLSAHRLRRLSLRR